MSKVLHIHAEQIRSLDDIYTLVESYITDTTPLASRNLDALSDVLCELPLEKIVIHEKRRLKDILEKGHDEYEDMTLYYRLLDVFVDLEGVDIELID